MFPFIYSDDTSTLVERKLLIKLYNELKKITTWISKNKLALNAIKSHYLIFQRSRIKNNNYNIEMGKIIVSTRYHTDTTKHQRVWTYY